MTDYEKLKKCFDEIGIEYEEYDSDNNQEPFILLESNFDYTVIQFVFDDQGKYKQMQ